MNRALPSPLHRRQTLDKTALAVVAVTFVMLGYLGTKNPGHVDLFLFKNVIWAQIGMVVYFAFFLLMPIYTRLDPTKAEPDRVG